MTNEERYDLIFKDTFNVNDDALNQTFTFRNVNQWDSVAHMSLVSKLEDTFDVLLESNDILHFESYENGKIILRRLGVEI